MIRSILITLAIVAITALAIVVYLLPGSSIAGGTLGALWLWRSRRRQTAALERWRAMTREQQLDETLPADWRTRTIGDTFPRRLQ